MNRPAVVPSSTGNRTQTSGALVATRLHGVHHSGPEGDDKKPTFTKIFRWKPPVGAGLHPTLVEIVGTMTNWERVPMLHDSRGQGWHLTLDKIPANKTHHYMLLVDGQPAHDAHCDGLAIPHTSQETKYAIQTPRGPRLFMLFSQTK